MNINNTEVKARGMEGEGSGGRNPRKAGNVRLPESLVVVVVMMIVITIIKLKNNR